MTRFTYDGDGKRVKKTEGATSTVYVGAMYEKNVTTGVTTTYYYAGATRVALRQGGVLYYLHGDHLGSTSAVTTITGTVVARQLYGPYGAPRWSSGTLPTDYRYTGQRAETGLGSLYDYGARFYSSFLNRFLSPDTIVPSPGNPQSLNRYSYVLNSPLRFMDPTGHRECEDERCTGPREQTVLDLFTNPKPWQVDLESALLGYYNTHLDYKPWLDTSLEFDQQSLAQHYYAIWDLDRAVRAKQAGQNIDIPWGPFAASSIMLFATVSGGGSSEIALSAEIGQKVYRLWGNRSKAYGKYWSPADPRTVPNYPDAAGLPSGNSGKYLSEGYLIDTDGIIVDKAKAIGDRPGGLTEYWIPDPRNQIKDITTTRLPTRIR